MNTIKLFTGAVVLILCGLILLKFNSGEKISHKELFNPQDDRISDSYSESNSEDKSRDDKIQKKLWKKEFHDKIYYPFSYPPPMEVLNRLQNDADIMPQEETDAAVLPWKSIGPFGFQIRAGSSAFHSGRLRDLDYSPITGKLTVVSASGGVFRYQVLFPVSIGDNLPFCNINSIACQPNDTNIIFIGTGEEGEGNGRGLLRTTNSGLNWQVHPMAPGFETPAYIFKVRYNNQNSQVMYAATFNGLQRSTNGGGTWTMQLSGLVTDFVVNPSNNNLVYACIVGSTTNSGVYLSTDGGGTFNELGSGLPADNTWGNAKIALSAADPARIYISLSKPDGTTQGVYRSFNSGIDWFNITPAVNFHGNGLTNQGNRNNTIGVSQTDPNRIFVGGVKSYVSTNMGNNWTMISTPQGHDDATRFITLPDGRIYWAHDGGVSGSVTNGDSWTTVFLNQLPTVEFYHVSTPMNEKLIIAGGTQDNGTPIYDNTGFWYNGTGGDGAGAVIDPVNTNRMLSFVWFFNGYSMHRNKTNDYFAANNIPFNNGIPPNSFWWGLLRHDFTPGVFFYTNSGPYIYSSDNSLTNWTQMNASAFPHDVFHFQSTAFISGSAFIYAALNNPSPNNSSKLRVYDGTGWYERNTGLPADRNINSIGILKSNKSEAVASISGINSPGQKIYRTVNAGLNWINITGNLTDMPVNTVLIDQDVPSIIYAGTEGFGIYRTSNNGINWSAWNYGLPRNARVRELSYIDSTGSKFTVVAGTYGRSVYIRDANDDDPVVGISGNNNIVKEYSLSQNYPNPFNPSTKIKFSLAGDEKVNIKIYDVTGKMITELISGSFTAGNHEVTFDGSEFSSGVYFYRITTSRFSDVKKMILVK